MATTNLLFKGLSDDVISAADAAEDVRLWHRRVPEADGAGLEAAQTDLVLALVGVDRHPWEVPE